MIMVTQLDAEQALRQVIETRETFRSVWTAIMGDGSGTIEDPDDPDYCFVRVHGLQNSVARVFNKAAPSNRDELPVLIGTTREVPHLVQVLSVDWAALPDWDGEALLPLHGDDHQFPGPDPTFIQKRAIVPLRASPQTTPDMTLQVASDFYPWDEGFKFFEGGDTEDLTARIPGDVGEGRFVLIYVDGATNALAYSNGDTYPAAWPSDVDDMIPEPPEGSIPVCAVRLVNGQTTVEEDDIYDLRIIVGPMGGSLAPAEHELDPRYGRHRGRLDTSRLWASVACCGAQ
jgi:hypothetical protein